MKWRERTWKRSVCLQCSGSNGRHKFVHPAGAFINAALTTVAKAGSEKGTGKKLKGCIIGGFVSAGTGFANVYSFLMLFLSPELLVSIADRAGMMVEAEISERAVLEALLYFRNNHVLTWLIVFALVPLIYRIWLWSATASWEELYVSEQMAYMARDSAYHMARIQPRNPLQSQGRIIASRRGYSSSRESSSFKLPSGRRRRSSKKSKGAGQAISIVLIIAVLLT